MPEPNRVVIDRVDWKSVLPVLRLVSAFKHALQPGKLLVALVAVLAIHFSGTVLDLIWFGTDGPGVYAELTSMYADSAQGLMHASLALDFSIDTMNSVPNILGRMLLWAPVALFQEHPWFTLIFGIDVLFVLAMASGILCHMSASQVCANRFTPLRRSVCFVTQRWAWYLLTPLMPALLIAVIGALLALAGLIFFNIPGVDVAGALSYGLFLLLGFVIAIVALLLLFALFLMPPALSVEASDGFDAIARSFNYILFRPWQFGFYLISTLVYLAVVSMLVGVVASLSIQAAGYFVGVGVVTDSDPTEPAAWIMMRWLELVSAIVTAILLSTFCCLQTQVYVLMRRSADGTPMDQYDGDESRELWAAQSATASAQSDDEAKAQE